MSDGYNMFSQPNFKDTKEMINEQEGIKDHIEIAKKMFSKNHSISDISDLTGLSPEEISKL